MNPIDGDALKEWFFRPYSNEELYSNVDVANRIDSMPTIKTEPVKHGGWIYNGRFCELNHYKCSVCGKDEFRMSPYCPNCGADMRGESDG